MICSNVSRREFLRGLGASALAGLMGPGLSAREDKRPNFLLLLTDDQVFDSIQSLNNPEVRTPNLDRLAERSVVFTHCFNQGSWTPAVCVASRAMLNTGQYIFQAQANIATAPLWGETLARGGYETWLAGKWHNGNATALRSFARGKGVGGGMYQAEDAYQRPGAGERYGEWAADVEKGGHWRPRVWDIVTDAEGGRSAGPGYHVEQHSSELHGDNAVEFLLGPGTASENPFFLYVSFHAPHDPRQAPREYLDLYDPEKILVPPNFAPEHPFDQGDQRIRDELLAPFPRTREAVRVHRAEYYAIISHFDHQVGRIMAALEATGKAENTYVMFTSDHGLAVGQHGLMGKQNQYDHSIRVPLLVSGPGLPAGRRVDRMVYLHSLFATTCELARLPVPETVQFPSLVPLLRGGDQVLHEEIFGAYRHFQRMIRTERWKLIVYPMAGETQLFDLRNDPHERHNLAGIPAFAELVADLKLRLQKLQNELGDELDLDAPEVVRNPGHPVRAAADGVFHLTPKAARTTGRLIYQPQRNNLGAWLDAEDRPSWQLLAVPAGAYRVRFAYGSNQAGVPYVLEIGLARIRGEITRTGGLLSYQWFDLGTVELTGGNLPVVLRPEAFAGPLANFRGIELVPE